MAKVPYSLREDKVYWIKVNTYNFCYTYSVMNTQADLNALHLRHHKKCLCELKKTAIQFVPGVGNPNADIVFIGEAPGKKEDEEGRPFIGRAGKFLDEMLDMIKLTRSDVYITNTVKYRPPDNRDPSALEKEQCHAWLVNELNTLQPKIIVTLGRHALNTFIPEANISEVHGTVLERHITLPSHTKQQATLSTSHFFALYHPAAALYNGSLRATLVEDFKKLPGILKKMKKVKN